MLEAGLPREVNVRAGKPCFDARSLYAVLYLALAYIRESAEESEKMRRLTLLTVLHVVLVILESWL